MPFSRRSENGASETGKGIDRQIVSGRNFPPMRAPHAKKKLVNAHTH